MGNSDSQFNSFIKGTKPNSVDAQVTQRSPQLDNCALITSATTWPNNEYFSVSDQYNTSPPTFSQ